jgi:acyl transferase domain-containing protein
MTQSVTWSNAQLRVMNPHVKTAFNDRSPNLPVQLDVVKSSFVEDLVAGVSSFGLNGTIAHVILSMPTEAAFSCHPTIAKSLLRHKARDVSLSASVAYRRRAFSWCDLSHPFVQHHLPSSDGGHVFRSPSSSFTALVANHVVQGRVIFPGSGYLEVARAAGATTLCGVYFLQPLVVDTPKLFFLECEVSSTDFEVRGVADGAFEDMVVHCSGATAADRVWQLVDPASQRSPSRAVHVARLYDNFHATGLQYGPGYRTLVQAWGGTYQALARLRPRWTHEGTQVHPADVDDALCSCAIIASDGGGEIRLPFALDDALLQGTTGVLFAVRCSIEPSSNTQRVTNLSLNDLLAGLVAARFGGSLRETWSNASPATSAA